MVTIENIKPLILKELENVGYIKIINKTTELSDTSDKEINNILK